MCPLLFKSSTIELATLSSDLPKALNIDIKASILKAEAAGAITTTAPSSAGQAVVRVGESVTATEFAIQPEPPILLT